MWEFFIGVSAACFFVVLFLNKGGKKNVRPREAIYAPAEDIIRYTVHKKGENVPAAPASYSFNDSKIDAPAIEIPAEEVVPTINTATDYGSNDTEKEDDEEKKAKFSALRFFDS